MNDILYMGKTGGGYHVNAENPEFSLRFNANNIVLCETHDVLDVEQIVGRETLELRLEYHDGRWQVLDDEILNTLVLQAYKKLYMS